MLLDTMFYYRMDVGEAEELYSAYGGTTPRSKVLVILC